MRVIDTFEISGRGVVVVVDETTDLQVSKKLFASVMRPDGSAILAGAFKEFRHLKPGEKEAFLLMGLSKSDVPIGSYLQFKDSRDT
jgi:hypothetical protein